MIARIKLQNGLDEEVIKQLEKEGEDSVEEAEEIREEIEWRNENIEEAARDFYEEFFGELEEEEEEKKIGKRMKTLQSMSLRLTIGVKKTKSYLKSLLILISMFYPF